MVTKQHTQHWLIVRDNIGDKTRRYIKVYSGLEPDGSFNKLWDLAREIDEVPDSNTPNSYWAKFETHLPIEEVPQTIVLEHDGDFIMDYFPNLGGVFTRLQRYGNSRSRRSYAGSLTEPCYVEVIDREPVLHHTQDKLVYLQYIRPTNLGVATSKESLIQEYEVVHLEQELPPLLREEASLWNTEFWTRFMDEEFNSSRRQTLQLAKAIADIMDGPIANSWISLPQRGIDSQRSQC